MPNLKTIRKRISSVKNTQQITKAMKMVSAARLRRAQEAAVASRPYAEKLEGVLRNVAATVESDAHPMLRAPETVERVALVVVTSDRGLCGAFNASLIRAAQRYLDANPGVEVEMSFVGRKGHEHYKRRAATIGGTWLRIPGPSIGLAREIAAELTPKFLAGEVQRIDVLYAHFKSALTQVPTVESLLPISVDSDAPSEDAGDLLIEPSARALLDRLLPRTVEARLYHALLESAAGEHGARMTAMDSATRNASKMISKLTLDMNRARQAIITTELMEIVSGAEALKG